MELRTDATARREFWMQCISCLESTQSLIHFESSTYFKGEAMQARVMELGEVNAGRTMLKMH